MAQGGVNYWLGETVMVGVQGGVASASDSETIDFVRTQYEWGAGVTGGALTLLGPVQLTIMTGSKNSFLVYASFGYDF
jgi:hypothetical protein